MGMDKVPSEERREWAADPVTISLRASLRAELTRGLDRLLFLSRKSSDPEVRAAVATYDGIEDHLEMTDAPSEDDDAGK